MSGFQGFAGLQPEVIEDPGATPEERSGGPANPAHGQWLWEDTPRFAWQSYYGQPVTDGSANPAIELIDNLPVSLPAGTDPDAYMDPSSTGSHGAPWPKFGVDDGNPNDAEHAAWRQQENRALHSAPDPYMLRRMGTELPANQQMQLEAEADYVSSGDSIVTHAGDLPNIYRGAYGRDRNQGFAPLNGFGFDSAHVRRPRYTGTVPGNFAWLTGNQRPMVVEHAGRQTYPVGQGSPFEGQQPGTGSVEGASLSGLPPSYGPPPAAPVGPALADAGSYAPDYGW